MNQSHTPLPDRPVIWITGSSRGLGRVMAEELCRRGGRVVVHGTRENSPQTFGEGESLPQVAADIARDCGSENGGETMAVWGDLTDPKTVHENAEQIRAAWGQIDILVCCAGGDIGKAGTSVGKGGRPEDDDCLNISLDDLHSVLDRNLLSTIYCCREVVPEMQARHAGRVITIGSIAGTSGRPAGSIYAVAKAAVHEYTRCLAAQLRTDHIPVNCVAPGPTVTQRFLRIHQIDDEKVTGEATLDRYGRPEEVATVVGFLCTEESRFISGQVIRVDGGGQTFPC